MKKLLLLLLCASSVSFAAKKPNVILIYTDDHGWADLGIHGQRDDVKTPQMDQMARDGALCKQGYVTAPQCSPSRSGVMSGRYQQRFGFEHNAMGPLPLDEKTLADRMKAGGYRTGFIGKWHLEPNWTMAGWTEKNLGIPDPTPKTAIPFEKVLPYYPKARGFDDVFKGELNRYWLNYGLDGKDRNPDGEWQDIKGYRLDIQTDAALSFIDRNKENPFFLYLCYFAPHVPMEATEKYLKRFPGEMPERRRYALAMISAMDDGIGRIRKQLAELDLDEDTLIFLIADNGAPLKIDMKDIPVSFPGGAWDGSMNTPLNGEKGMILEGGVHVPYVVCWPGTIPANTVIEDPVISLDVSPTSLAAAGLPLTDDLDGIDLLPRLTGKAKELPERDLFWKFWNQAAVRRGDWKYVQVSDGREWLFNLAEDMPEKNNLVSEHPERAERLRAALDKQLKEFEPDHLRSGPVNDQETKWFEHYLRTD
ncbi:sulfatase-like hydrolase/transferase [Pontiellaceae bacterium B12227]|nr:sulfatase-like hydrolase/transferase [Pontiellaceae bacterium B12227]